MKLFNPKVKHYNQAITNLKKQIWNLEFDVASLRTIREGFRIEYDRIRETISGLEERIKNLKVRNNEDDPAEIKDVEKQIEAYSNDCDQLQEQMQGLDNEIDGLTYKDDKDQMRRHEGIVEKMGKLNTRIDMLKEHIAKL